MKKLKFQNLGQIFCTFPSHKVDVKWSFIVNVPLSIQHKNNTEVEDYCAFREPPKPPKVEALTLGGWVVLEVE